MWFSEYSKNSIYSRTYTIKSKKDSFLKNLKEATTINEKNHHSIGT